MSKRLEITVFGTLYVVGAIHLPRSVIQAGMKAYGQKQWHTLVGDIALGLAGTKVSQEVSNVLGHSLKPSLLIRGVGMHGRGFGFEVFHDGEFAPVNAVEAENSTVNPQELMKSCQPGDMLGVFWTQCEDVMFFRWDDVDELRQEDVALTYDSLGPLLGKGMAFDLIMDVTWQGKRGRRQTNGKKLLFHSRQHVLHKVS